MRRKEREYERETSVAVSSLFTIKSITKMSLRAPTFFASAHDEPIRIGMVTQQQCSQEVKPIDYMR